MAITSDADKLRLALGDRDPDNYIFNDDEIAAFLAAEGDIPSATLAAARSAELTFARAYDFETDGQRFYRSQMAKAFAKVVDRLVAAGVSTTADVGASSIDTFAATKVDGYTQDVDSQEVSGGSSAVNNREKYYAPDGFDSLPT